MITKDNTVVLYHKGCNDGLGAAWAASKVLPEGTPLIQYQYGDKLPEQVYGKHLILVDLSLTPEQIAEIHPNHVKSIMIIDHHKTAIEKLGRLPALYSYENYLVERENGGVYMLVDISRSGAVLAWAFFNNCLTAENWTAEVPLALQYIEDYDLWKFDFKLTDAVNAWMINCAPNVESLSEAINDDGHFETEVIEIGETLVKYDVGIVKSVAKGYVQEGTWNGYRYAIVNGPHHLRNRLGDYLNSRYDFTVCYNQRRDKVVFSLRAAEDSSVDLTKIAERFGGGGHAKAAAFAVNHGMQRTLFATNPFSKPTLLQRMKLVWWALTARNLI